MPDRRHLATVALEDYYQVGAFNRLIQRGQWYRFERRVERGTDRTLAMLDEHGARATFFVLGWVADAMPELVARVAARGHEIASKGYYHRSIQQMTPSEFREDLARAREAIERAARQRVLGFRVAHQWFLPEDLWALDVLAAEGYDYDSSIAPLFRQYAHEPWRRFPHEHRFADRRLMELPLPTTSILGFDMPIAGGNWFRQMPHAFMKRAVSHWVHTYTAPFLMYFHTWELDPDQPKIDAAPATARYRHYHGLRKMPVVLRHYFSRYRFTSVAEYMGLSTRPLVAAKPAETPAVRRPTPVVTAAPPRRADLPEVSVVIPVFNEELIVPYLANTLASVEEKLNDRYALRFVFVDDGSSDGTWEALQRMFGGRANCLLVQHAQNSGVAAAIMTGIRRAPTELVCSIDCDCTYDPHELARMLPLLAPDVDMVTASPYHPAGGVRNVPQWRLALSRNLSRMYRMVLNTQLATYTSCFRAYRKSRMEAIEIRRGGFLGVAEMLGVLDLRGGRIVEFPTVLEVRMLGRSKMKVLRTIIGHLKLISSLVQMRAAGVEPLPEPQPVALPADAVRSATVITPPEGTRV